MKLLSQNESETMKYFKLKTKIKKELDLEKVPITYTC